MDVEANVEAVCSGLNTLTLRMMYQFSNDTGGRWILILVFDPEQHSGKRAFSHDVTAAILVYQNNETAAMLVYQTNPMGVELFSYVKTFVCSNKFAWLLAT